MTSEVSDVADEIEHKAIGAIGVDEDTGGATMVGRSKLLDWTERLREHEADSA